MAAAIREVLDRQSEVTSTRRWRSRSSTVRKRGRTARGILFRTLTRGLYRTELERITHDKDLHFEGDFDWRHEVEVRDGIIRKYRICAHSYSSAFQKLVKALSGTPLVDVVLVNYNGRDFLNLCLPALLTQDYPSEAYQVIVVDNARTIHRWKCCADFPQVNHRQSNQSWFRRRKQHRHAGHNRRICRAGQ